MGILTFTILHLTLDSFPAKEDSMNHGVLESVMLSHLY